MTITSKKSRQSRKNNAIDVMIQPKYQMVPHTPIIIPNLMYNIDPDDYVPSTMRGKHILVLGATGGLGAQVVNQALDASYHVTALVQNDINLPFTRHQLRNPNLVIVVGSVLSRDDLDKVIEHQDAIINCLGPKPLFATDIDICSRSQSLIISSMKQFGVRRLIAVTCQGVTDDFDDDNFIKSTCAIQPQLTNGIQKFFENLFSGKILQDKAIQERIIINNTKAIDWTIIRPGKLTNGQLTNEYTINEKANYNKVSRANVAHFILKELRSAEWARKCVSVNSY
ncbi:8211_t:CDS:2 [Cetraspora pellucida]|uniref:8211_t:CDS:1 n=1 Tax=Cetraspora pellucida TaxID=1433469 RepID=A0A9N9FTT0_9GLOM|nr:8211_t:CDS:2 [Cetraspora pellucida]